MYNRPLLTYSWSRARLIIWGTIDRRRPGHAPSVMLVAILYHLSDLLRKKTHMQVRVEICSVKGEGDINGEW